MIRGTTQHCRQLHRGVQRCGAAFQRCADSRLDQKAADGSHGCAQALRGPGPVIFANKCRSHLDHLCERGKRGRALSSKLLFDGHTSIEARLTDAAGYTTTVTQLSHRGITLTPCNCSALVGTATRLIRDEHYRRVAVVLVGPLPPPTLQLKTSRTQDVAEP